MREFILGMLMLVAAQAVHVRYALWSSSKANAAAQRGGLHGAEMLAFFNNKLAGGIAPACKASGLPETKNMGDLVRRWLKLQFSLLGGSDGNLLTQKLGKPCARVAVVLLGMALYFSLPRRAMDPSVAHLDEDGDGDVSWAEVEAFGRRSARPWSRRAALAPVCFSKIFCAIASPPRATQSGAHRRETAARQTARRGSSSGRGCGSFAREARRLDGGVEEDGRSGDAASQLRRQGARRRRLAEARWTCRGGLGRRGASGES